MFRRRKKVNTLELKLLFYIIESLKDLYEYDDYLIKINGDQDHPDHVGERSIVFRFGYYLQKRLELDSDFRVYNLDCEYNRNGNQRKELYGSGTYPDLILHKRGSNDHNIMVIEFKGYWNHDQRNDRKKICGFTSEIGDYKYSVGYTILFGQDLFDVVIEEYKKGKKSGEFGMDDLLEFFPLVWNHR